MFKCSECGCEYEIKPDFCDCGNDVFIEETISTEKKQEAIVEMSEIKPQPAKVQSSKNTSFIPSKSTNQIKIDPISISVFLICILLSLFILFVWEPTTKNISNEVQNAKKETSSITTNIPQIDKIWNNTPVKTDIKKSIEPITQTNVISAAPQKPVQKTIIQQKNTEKKVTKQTTKKENSPSVKTVNTKTNQTPVTILPPKTSTNPQKHVEPKSEQKQPVQQELKNTQPKQEPVILQQDSAQIQQEYINYKVALRNTIGRKIDFTKVIGDGSCVVAFQIDSSGKLINRSFAKQSSNMTLNDAVYSAVMSTPRYNPPPTGYHNEVLHLTIKFLNGNFEISIR